MPNISLPPTPISNAREWRRWAQNIVDTLGGPAGTAVIEAELTGIDPPSTPAAVFHLIAQVAEMMVQIQAQPTSAAEIAALRKRLDALEATQAMGAPDTTADVRKRVAALETRLEAL